MIFACFLRLGISKIAKKLNSTVTANLKDTNSPGLNFSSLLV